jgi:uncharacterized OB-fold protein
MSKIASPSVTTETAQFWAKANDGQLTVPQCKSCGKFHWYPRAYCPFCDSDKVELQPAKGTGTIYSYSVARRGKDSYVIAYVTLAIGQGVRVALVESENGQRVPMFEPA